jgi:hypothetical protein
MGLCELTRKEFEPFEAKTIVSYTNQPRFPDSSYRFLTTIIAYWQQINYDVDWFSERKQAMIEDYIL